MSAYKKTSPCSTPLMYTNLIHIKSDLSKIDLKKEIVQGLLKDDKTLPTLLLYDDKGLQLFDKITYLNEYYLTLAEIDILNKDLKSIASYINDDSIIVELGSGSLRKTKLILDHVDKNKTNIEYYALDVESKELVKSIKNLHDYKHIKTYGLVGTYEDGMKYMNNTFDGKNKCVLWLGSSIGNYEPKQAFEFLKNLQCCMNTGDRLLMGVDLLNSENEISKAYNDSEKVSREFILNALNNANNIMNQNAFDLDNFEFHSIVNMEGRYHESCIMSKSPQTLNIKYNNQDLEINLQQNELIHIEYSFKYPVPILLEMMRSTKFKYDKHWLSTKQNYAMYMFTLGEQ